MKELKFDTGLVTYKVNGGAEIRFNPTDTEFTKKVLGIFRDLTDKQEKYREMLGADAETPNVDTALEDPEAAKKLNEQADVILTAITQMDQDMREAIDSAFGTKGTADAVFGSASLYAYADGLPLWANFLLAVIDEMPASVEKQASLTDPRLRAHVGKYSAKYGKRK